MSEVVIGIIVLTVIFVFCVWNNIKHCIEERIIIRKLWELHFDPRYGYWTCVRIADRRIIGTLFCGTVRTAVLRNVNDTLRIVVMAPDPELVQESRVWMKLRDSKAEPDTYFGIMDLYFVPEVDLTLRPQPTSSQQFVRSGD